MVGGKANFGELSIVGQMSKDTIDVRQDERFDEAALEGYLRGRLPGSENPLRVRQFGGGAANLTYLLDFGTHQYVLRRPPLGPVAKSAHDMAREYKVLSVLHQAFPFAPQAFLYCEDPAIIGSDFFVMARQEGIVVRRKLPPTFANLPDAPRQMSEALVDTLAQLHAVDYAALGLADLGENQMALLSGRSRDGTSAGTLPKRLICLKWIISTNG